MKKKLYILFFYFATFSVSAQSKTVFGIGTSVTHDFIEIFDPAYHMVDVPRIGFKIELSANHYFSEHFAVGYGFFVRNIWEGFGFDIIGGFSKSTSVTTLNIPLRLSPKITLIKNKLTVHPTIGASFGFNLNFGETHNGYGMVGNGKDSIRYVTFSDNDFTQTFVLLQMGISIDYWISERSLLSLYSNYYTGTQRIIQTNVSYQINIDPHINAQTASNGTFWEILGLSFQFGPKRKTKKVNES